MSTTDLTIHIRPPFDDAPVRPELLRQAEVLSLRPIAPASPEIRVPRVRPGLFREIVPSGTYEIAIDLDTLASWVVPRWRVRVRGERQRLQLFMGQRDWRSYTIGYSLVPFRPPTAVAVVFETAPPTPTEAEALLAALRGEFEFTAVPDSLGALRIGDRYFPAAEGSILLMRGDLAVHDPAEIERYVASFLNRDSTLARPRVGVAVDLRPGRVKVLDRRFVLRHDRGSVAARLIVEQHGGRWIRDLDIEEGTVLFELAGGDHERQLDLLEVVRRNEEVAYAEPDLMSELADAAPLFARELEGFLDAKEFLHEHRLPRHGSSNVTIAILDRNFRYLPKAGKIDNLQAPRNQVVGFRDFRHAASPAPSADPVHGMKVYGVIGAEFNDFGAEGVAHETSILLAERCSVSSSSYNDILLWLCGLKNVVAGFANASAPNPHPADVVCCAHVSNGPRSEAFSAAMRQIVAKGRVANGKSKGAIVIYAAGNDNSDVSVANGFADDPNTIAVANCRVNRTANASDPKRFVRVSSSNFGAAIDLCALGHQSHTLVIGGDAPWRGGGTSAACAAVAGAILLTLTAFPNETSVQIRRRLQSGAEQIDRYQGDAEGVWVGDHSGYYGHGLLNVYKSMQ